MRKPYFTTTTNWPNWSTFWWRPNKFLPKMISSMQTAKSFCRTDVILSTWQASFCPVFEMAAMPFPCNSLLLWYVNIPTVLLMFFNEFASCSIPCFNLKSRLIMIFKSSYLLSKKGSSSSFGEKNNRNMNPLKTFHLPSFAMISLLVLFTVHGRNLQFVVRSY